MLARHTSPPEKDRSGVVPQNIRACSALPLPMFLFNFEFCGSHWRVEASASPADPYLGAICDTYIFDYSGGITSWCAFVYRYVSCQSATWQGVIIAPPRHLAGVFFHFPSSQILGCDVHAQ